MKTQVGAWAQRGLQGVVLVGIAAVGALALRPVQTPEADPQPLLRRAESLRRAVAREPRSATLYLQLARAELAGAQTLALQAYSSRFPETAGEPADEVRARYDAWRMGYLRASPAAARAILHARRAAALAPTTTQRAEALVVAGSAAWQRGSERAGLAFFRAACRARPAWRPAWVRLAAAAAERGDEALLAEARCHLASPAGPEAEAAVPFQAPAETGAGRRAPIPAAASRAPSEGAAPSAAPSTGPRTGTPPRPSTES
jgi:hypothetical protein